MHYKLWTIKFPDKQTGKNKLQLAAGMGFDSQKHAGFDMVVCPERLLCKKYF